jgi:hypothetical protein
VADREAVDGLMMAFAAEKAMDKGPKLVKVREVIFSEDGRVVAKFALVWETGKWVRVGEMQSYPQGCFKRIG